MSGFDPRGRVNRALLVGVSEYDLTEPPYGVPGDLPAVARNLDRMDEALRGGGVFGAREVTVCRSPDQVAFGRALRTAAQEAGGVLLLYFAGHGAIPSAGDELFLQTRNASVVAGGQAVFPGAEMFSTVLAVLAASPARRIVVVLDCCFAGNAAWLWETFRDKRRVLLLMSVQANHRTDAGDPGTPTPFTAELVPLLEAGGELWFSELANALRAGMAAAGHRTVRGDAWEPQSRREPEEDVLLAAGRKERGEGAAGEGSAPEGAGDRAPRESGGRGRAGQHRPGHGAEGRRSGHAAHEGRRPGHGPGERHRTESRVPPGGGRPRHPGADGRRPGHAGPGPSGGRRHPDPRPAPPGPGSGTGTGTGTERRPARLRTAPRTVAAVFAALAARLRGDRRGPGILRVPDRRVPDRSAPDRPVPDLAGRPARRLLTAAALLLLVAGLGLAAYGLAGRADSAAASCRPALELRVLTDPDLEPTVRAAADAYLTSADNTDGDGCRRTGITVYGAGAADAVAALRRQTGAWQEPHDDDTNPQRDVGPQPDVWIPGSRADADRVAGGQDTDAVAALEVVGDPLAYSPIVLAVPQEIAADALDERSGPPLGRMIDTLRARHPGAEVRRPDPEFTDTGLLATIGLYGTPDDGAPAGTGVRDPARAEDRVAQATPPSPTAAELLCALPDDDAVDDRTAALVPEFLMKSGLGCDSVRRTPRMAQYPGDVPGLEPVFTRVRWRGADRDTGARDRAADGFRAWLTGAGGRAVFARAGFRAPGGDRALLAPEDVSGAVLRAPAPLTESAGRDAMEAALADYRAAGGPGRVLFLLDSSGSMNGRFEGPSGGPGLLRQSLGGLGEEDEYAVWSVYGTGADGDGDTYRTLLPFGSHPRADAERALGRAAVVRGAESDPPGALRAALDTMERRGDADERPDLIVYVTDDEDANRLAGDRLADVLALARASDVPVTMVSLQGGGCAPGKPDARISAAGGGRCLDADDDLGAALHDEVARTGTGEG
ncbi:caspase family protein [Streptomyces sp. NPDC048182]|uniref:caspase family protein n=1 Tax=Streptomyces sp. NPDC048182 TaxID=3365507 RepID=UPI0037186517